MLNKYKQILNCDSLSLKYVNHNIFYDVDKKCYVNDQVSSIPVDSILFENNNKVFYFEDGSLFRMDTVSEISKEIYIKDSSYINPVSNHYLIYERKSRKEKIYSLIDDKKNIIWISEGNIEIKVINDYLFKSNSENSFTILDIKTGKPLWLHKLTEKSKIYGDLHLHQEILVVPQENEQSQITLVGLDINTGKKLWETKTALAYYKKKNGFLYGFASTSFGDNYYSEVNIETGEVFEKSFENFTENVVSHLAMIKDDFLYFSIYKNNCKIGILDLKRKKIIYEHSLGLDNGVQIGAPVVTDDKLYVLDSTNTLHVFKKEENMSIS